MKEESEDVRIDEAFRFKQEDTEETGQFSFLKLTLNLVLIKMLTSVEINEIL